MKPNPTERSWWTEKRRKAHSKLMTEWFTWQEMDISERGWTPEKRAKQAKIVAKIWAKRSKAERDKVRSAMRIAALEREIELRIALGRKTHKQFMLLRELKKKAGR